MTKTPRKASARRIATFAAAATLTAALVVVVAPPAAAATITPNVFTDDITINGNCTLREAIQAANTDLAVDNCTAGSGADTISLAAGTYTLSLAGAGEDDNQTGDLDISSAITIDGAGAQLTVIDADDIDRVLHATLTGALTLSELTVTDGTASGGGGILASSDPLTLTDVAVTNNTATDAVAAHGGGIRVAGAGGVATITRSTISGNSATGAGGGIEFFDSGAASITNSTISNNTANQGGGIAARADAQDVTLVNATVAANSATEGGGLWAGVFQPGHAFRPTNTIVADNSAPTGPDCFAGSGEFVSGGNTLVENINACSITAGAGDITEQDPALAALAANGGGTETHALLTGSLALDAGSNAACAAAPVNGLDQRGLARPQGATCDIGAYEALQLTIADLSQNEGDAGATAFNFPVTLSAAVPAGFPSVTVDYATAAGGANPATAGADYTAVAATPLTFTAAGGSTQNAAVTVGGDTTVEPDETFLMNLANAANAVITDAQAQGTILNDDAAPPPPSPVADLQVTKTDSEDP